LRCGESSFYLLAFACLLAALLLVVVVVVVVVHRSVSRGVVTSLWFVSWPSFCFAASVSF